MNKIGLLGGTFNPIHNGHLAVAQTILKKTKLDSVLFLPSGNPPHKKNKILPFNKRFYLIKKALKPYSKLIPSKLDLKDDGGKTYTRDLIPKLNEIYHDSHFYFIIGEDNVEDLQNWYDYKWLLDNITFLVVSRNISSKKKWQDLDYLKKLEFVRMKPVDISSSQIRKRIKNNETIMNLVPHNILNDILSWKKYLI